MELIIKEFDGCIKPRLCLNMIVKNESHIIENTLDKLLQKIPFDYWVISDTGSTDNTKEIISKFFTAKNIQGELFDDKWEDFGHNRTIALEHAYGKSDYILVFDADDEICGNFILPELIKDSYSLQFGDANGTSYTRPQIVTNHKKWKYIGVLHELIECCEHADGTVVIRGDYYTISGRTSDRNRDENKYLKDALILEKAYNKSFAEKDAIFNRYGFYCANSYYDAGKYEKAIKWFKITLDNNNWTQEKYVSCLRIYNCYSALKQNESGLFYLVKAFSYDKERVECLYELVSYYCVQGMNDVARGYYTINKAFYSENYLTQGLQDKLFLDVNKADFFLPYYMIIVSDRTQDLDTAIQMYKIVFTKKYKETNQFFTGNLLYNLQFFIEKAKDDTAFIHLFKEYVQFLISIDYPIYKHEFMANFEKYGINNTDSVISVFKKEEYFKSKKILIYTGYMNFLWNDSTVKTQSIGGAEKAVVYLSRQFPKDFDIYVVGDQVEEQIDNISYINRNKLQQLLNQNEFHTIIISRYVSFFEEYNNIKCYKLLLYAHDSTGFINNYNRKDINYILEKYNDCVDRVVCLTNWHSNNIIERHPFLKDKMEIINNGINIVDFPTNKIQKFSNKFVWSSCAYRGLHILLNLWSDILEILPDATLDICSYDSFPKNKEEEEMLKTINVYDSITYRGKLNTSELYDLMAKSEYWLYTNTFPETSCITGMEMLMSEVICIYYPLAGLVDTVGDYGIPIERGQEIETIVNLTNKRKTEIRKRGKEYALSCSWENRAKKWTELLGLNICNKYRIPEERITYSKKINKLGIFNSFPFHYEMFGFILNYAQNNNYEVDIFTNKNNALGWFEFYREKFNNFNINDISKFNGDTSEYATFFLTTDDDTMFKSEWIRDNVVCVNHYYRIRTSNFKHYLNIANFKDSTLEYVYPCYPLINYRDKIQNSTNVCIIGGGNIHHNHNINVINRLQSNGRIKLNIFVRKECKTDISELEMNKFDINFIEDISTSKMIQILNQSSYVLVNYNNNEDHNNGISCSGSLQLALSTLCKPIIVNTANKYLQIKNALEYDIKSNEPIFIHKEINFQLLEQERNNYVDKFDKYIGNILSTVYLRILSDSGTSNNMEDWMQTDKLSYIYNKPVILTKKDDFTHCIIINSGMPHLNINKNKVVGISHEPTLPQEPVLSQLIEYSKNNMSKYFIGDKNNLPEPFTEGQPFMFHNTTRYNNIIKTKFCSIVISGKQFTMGHKYRHQLVEAILKTDLPIDIYGYGVETYKQKMDDPRLKYSLENTLKNPFGTDPFIDYKFHICIENMVSNNYFSEKIINPLLSNVIPIYYGCKKIDNYFDNIIKLSGNEEDDIASLKYIYQNQNIYDNNINSDKILDKCNVFYNLHTFFDDIKLKDEIIIPKKIFQTWETIDIEPEFQQIINKWKENNPNYEYIFHDAEQRLQFIQDNFKENVLNAYKKIIPGAYKCDLWRYCVLYIYGGFYADIDTLCMGKLNSLTNENIEFIVPIDLNINPREGEHNLACGFIGSVPKSPILLDAIDRIVFNVENNIIPTSKLDFSGPGLLGRSVNKFLNLDETSSFKGKEGIRNKINFLEFDPNTEYMKDVRTDSTILQNKNRNSDIIRLYNNECNKIKNYTCWLSNNVINTDL